MKKTMISAICLALCGLASTTAQEKVLVNGTDNISNGTKVENVGRISFNEAETELSITTVDETVTPFTIDDIVDVTFEDVPDAIQIIYSEGDARIINPFACEGVTATKSGADVTITATSEASIEYILSGTASDGSLKLFNTGKATITLNGVSLTNPDCPAIGVQGAGAATIKINSGTTNTLADGADYVIPDGESAKGAVYVKGKLTIEGDGSLHVSSAYKHAIVADKSITVNGGNITVDNTASDAFHSKKGFTMNGGNLTLAADGDGIDGDADIVEIKSGTLNITVAVDASKGLKTDGNIAISGGTITINATGGVEVTDGDPSYCTAIKADGTVDITGGDITITSIGEAGKGISADGTITISDGKLGITTSGNGATYTDMNGLTDSYAATCISGDADIIISGGNITLESRGLAGKGVSSDKNIVIGSETGGPELSVTTSGARFYVTGTGDEADYASPNAIKADSTLTVLGGTINVTTKAEGGDGLESDSTLTIAGGKITINAFDDAIESTRLLTISGGEIGITVAQNTSKGIKSDSQIDITGGDITINTTGGVVVTDGDPSYCTAIKCDGSVNVSGGNIVVTSTGEAGKGISADGDVNISGGTIDITTSGNGATYTDATGTLDSYSATCIKADGNINITGGNITAKSSGSAGKGISSDGDMTIGGVEGIEPIINVSTTGAKFLVSNGSGSTGGWGGGPGGGMDNADYANPKAIKADGNLTINSGKINVSTQQDGGEGLESKKVLTINGGTIEAITYDDAINAAQNITINGGMIYCYASGNDGMDSNGTININGGVVISSGTSQPE
ncbi:MAG: carbohydrate-binding domain-containing protein, partial [Muribaculaceae bacterium]